VTETGFTDIGALADFPNGSQRTLELAGQELLLVRVGEEVFAVRNQCTHLGQPLTGGRMIGRQITCPFHGACFDLRTGRAIAGPAVVPLSCLQVRIENGRILLQPPA